MNTSTAHKSLSQSVNIQFDWSYYQGKNTCQVSPVSSSSSTKITFKGPPLSLHFYDNLVLKLKSNRSFTNRQQFCNKIPPTSSFHYLVILLQFLACHVLILLTRRLGICSQINFGHNFIFQTTNVPFFPVWGGVKEDNVTFLPYFSQAFLGALCQPKILTAQSSNPT